MFVSICRRVWLSDLSEAFLPSNIVLVRVLAKQRNHGFYQIENRCLSKQVSQ
ncbi:hypothetical protein V12B01_12585 [Vibrio splendidus 12B01]|nr:hypothetical protein V12B01_12585 [Vibrio splendidus 12B01]